MPHPQPPPRQRFSALKSYFMVADRQSPVKRPSRGVCPRCSRHYQESRTSCKTRCGKGALALAARPRRTCHTRQGHASRVTAKREMRLWYGRNPAPLPCHARLARTFPTTAAPPKISALNSHSTVANSRTARKTPLSRGLSPVVPDITKNQEPVAKHDVARASSPLLQGRGGLATSGRAGAPRTPPP